MDTFYDVIRLVNAVTASIVFGALCYKGRLYFKSYDRHQKLLYVSFTIYTFATAYASVEAYNMNLSPAANVFPFFVANVVALYAFFRYRESAFGPKSLR